MPMQRKDLSPTWPVECSVQCLTTPTQSVIYSVAVVNTLTPPVVPDPLQPVVTVEEKESVVKV